MANIGFTEKQLHVYHRFNALRRAYEDAVWGGRVYNPDFLAVLMDAFEKLENCKEKNQQLIAWNGQMQAEVISKSGTSKQNQMKYRVKIPCYHYNTGSADNYSYVGKHDFETKEQADAFAKKVNEQYEMHSKFEKHEIAFSVYEIWFKKLKHTGELYEVEDGYVTGFAKVIEFIPEQENELQ